MDRLIEEARTGARNIADAIAKVGLSETLGEQLREKEDHLRRLREERSRLATVTDRSRSIPTRDTIVSYLTNIRTTLDSDPVRGNAILTKHLGQLTMTPMKEGDQRWYRASGAFDLSFDLATLGKSSCASAQ